MKPRTDNPTETRAEETSEAVTAAALVRFTLDLPEHLHREFKMAAVSEGRSMRSLALEWVRAGVDGINATAKKR